MSMDCTMPTMMLYASTPKMIKAMRKKIPAPPLDRVCSGKPGL